MSPRHLGGPTTTRRPTARTPDGRSEPPIAPPAPTGDVALDAVASAGVEWLNPILAGPHADAGGLGVASYALNGVLGSIGFALATAPDFAFGASTAEYAAKLPAFPAARLSDMQVGPVHAHLHPPSYVSPAPPVPLPSFGMITAAGAVTVLIEGLPAARAGDVGLAMTCGSWVPSFEIVTGSSNVFIGGARAARMSDITRHCNPMDMAGVILGALGVVASGMNAGVDATMNPAAAAASAAQAGADAVAYAISRSVGKDPAIPSLTLGMVIGTAGTVKIGGLPVPSVLEMASGLLKLLRRIRARRARPDATDPHPRGGAAGC